MIWTTINFLLDYQLFGSSIYRLSHKSSKVCQTFSGFIFSNAVICCFSSVLYPCKMNISDKKYEDVKSQIFDQYFSLSYFLTFNMSLNWLVEHEKVKQQLFWFDWLMVWHFSSQNAKYLLAPASPKKGFVVFLCHLL